MTAKTVLAENYLGNLSESEALARSVARAEEANLCLAVAVERSDRAKGRILTQTASGQPVGISKGRGWLLRDGDVFSVGGVGGASLGENRLVLVSVQAQRVMALTFSLGVQNDPTALVQLGHVLGNRHWPVAIKEQTLYIELVAEAALIESTLKETAARLNLEGVQIKTVSRTASNALDFHSEHTHHH